MRWSCNSLVPARATQLSYVWLLPRRAYSSRAEPKSLRILYCGSDEFSAASLEKLHQEHSRDKSFIGSLDVVCKTGKPSGKGLKTIRHVPLKQLARDLELPLHEIPTFTGWTPPVPYDLIIAVSFGLLVPKRLLDGATYGGLNLHPSLLPSFRGPAPLHHTLMEGLTQSGVTLQTLHPRHFDQGRIVSQTTFELPRRGDCTFHELRSFVGPIAAQLLVDSLKQGLFLSADNPSSDGHVGDQGNATQSLSSVTHARKIVPEDSHVDWQTWDSARIFRVQRALGTLWSKQPSQKAGDLRVQWHGLSIASEMAPATVDRMEAGRLYVRSQGPKKLAQLLIKTCDVVVLAPHSLTIEGRKRNMPPEVASNILVAHHLK